MTDKPKYSTTMHWDQNHWVVQVILEDKPVMEMPLDDWMKLDAVKYTAEEINKAKGPEPLMEAPNAE